MTALDRLRAARFEGEQALYTTAVQLLSERPAVPDDLAGLVDAGRRMSPRLDMLDCETVLQMADAIEALAAEAEKAVQWAKEQHACADEYAARIEALTAREALAAREPMCAVVRPILADGGAIVTRPEADVRAEAWAAAVDAAASMIEDNVRHAMELGREIWPMPDLRCLAPTAVDGSADQKTDGKGGAA